MKYTDWSKLREIRTGYILSKEQIAALSPEEKEARKEVIKERQHFMKLIGQWERMAMITGDLLWRTEFTQMLENMKKHLKEKV